MFIMGDKYEKLEVDEIGDFFLRSKHVPYNDMVSNMLWDALKNSKYTKNELAERLDWAVHRLMMVISGDDTLNIYDMVHVSGALGYEFKFELVKIED